MRNTASPDRRCSYVVVVQGAASSEPELRELAAYLSATGVAGCEVILLDPSPCARFESNARILRWVGRHVAAGPEHCTPAGSLDRVRASAALASCEKVIVATDDVRYTPQAIDQLCDLLDLHEVVEPQDYLEPLPWWGSIEVGRILVHRGIEPEPDHGATFGFRRGTVRALRTLGSGDFFEDPARRLGSAGAEVFAAANVFVRREPGPFDQWLAQRPRVAGEELALPLKTAFFLSLVPLLVLLGIAGGVRLALGYTSVIAFATVVLAVRGRVGAAAFFPLRACLFAPLWVMERSVSVYWALFRKLRGSEADPARIAVPQRAAGAKVASGE